MEKTVMDRLREHYNEALQYFPEKQILGIFLQGSQNYKLDYENSDIDTKLIVIPSFEDICFNKKPKSHTHVRENDEHIDFKDIRLMFQTFRKQNVNFVEILFTEFKIINPEYEDLWNKLIEHKEELARYNEFNAVKCMKGMALEKFHALKHEYPSKVEVLAKYGYDPKQLHHLVRFNYFLKDYLSGKDYGKCLITNKANRKELIDIKKGKYSLTEAEKIAEDNLEEIKKIADDFTNTHLSENNEDMDKLLDKIQIQVIKRALRKELKEND